MFIPDVRRHNMTVEILQIAEGKLHKAAAFTEGIAQDPFSEDLDSKFAGALYQLVVVLPFIQAI